MCQEAAQELVYEERERKTPVPETLKKCGRQIGDAQVRVVSHPECPESYTKGSKAAGKKVAGREARYLSKIHGKLKVNQVPKNTEFRERKKYS